VITCAVNTCSLANLGVCQTEWTRVTRRRRGLHSLYCWYRPIQIQLVVSSDIFKTISLLITRNLASLAEKFCTKCDLKPTTSGTNYQVCGPALACFRPRGRQGISKALTSITPILSLDSNLDLVPDRRHWYDTTADKFRPCQSPLYHRPVAVIPKACNS